MKKIKKSFLFFILLFSFFRGVSQVKIDSSKYYLSLLINPKKEIDLPKAYNYFQKNKKDALKDKDTIKAIYNMCLMANLEFKLGLLYESEKTAVEALEFQKLVDNKNYLATLYNHLGKVNRIREDYNTAYIYYNKLKGVVKESKEKISLFNNLGIALLYQEKYNDAILNFEEAYEYSLEVGDSLKISLCLDNLGYTQSKINNDSGLVNMERAYQLRKRINTPIAILTSINHFFNFYLDRNDLNKAYKYAVEGLELSNKLKSPSYKLQALENLVKLKKEQYFLDYINLNDSINNIEQVKKNRFISVKYNYFQEEIKAQENLLKAEKEKKHKLIYQSIGAFILLISIAGYFFYREKNKKKIVENVIQTEGRISKTVHDVIANDLYQVMTKLQISNNITDEVLDDLESVYSKARNISRDNYVIEEDMDYFEIINDLFLSYQSNEVTVITQNLKNVTWENVSIHKRNMLYRVLKELMTNMTKYSQATLVTVLFKEKSKNLEISYKDNGVGCVLAKKNGLLNAETRIKSVNGTITFESEPQKGFKTKIII